ncbi:SEA/GATOR complex protein SEA4/MIOS [Microdochium nivale]|nr:SEA/GATOR complex protein SEA4/MIOS [Microdochium nivale]
MDRPEPGLIKWSPSPDRDSFIHVNLTQRVVQLYQPTGQAHRGRFDYDKLQKHDESPPLTTYDWSPLIPDLVAVGTASGTVNLLRIDGSNGYYELPIRQGRMCQSVAFNTGSLLAVGLDRVRNDQCLHIWDVNRLANRKEPGLPTDSQGTREADRAVPPVRQIEPSVSVSSTKFFEDSPQTLVAAVKNQGIRIYDLRDPQGAVVNFQTRCNNNIAIDYADPNYFASSSLDQPAVIVWDRRAAARASSSPTYLEAVDSESLPWGAALKVETAIDVDPRQFNDRHSLIRSLRFCRDQRGLLAALSRTGQLKVYETHKEASNPEVMYENSPELLDIRKSSDLDLGHIQASEFKNDRIVSFDWVNLSSPVLKPRVVVLRQNGSFDILEKPSFTADHVYKMVPWQAPHRGLLEGSSYHSMMRFDAPTYREMLGSRLIDDALAEIALFGENKTSLKPIIQAVLQSQPPDQDVVQDAMASSQPLPDGLKDMSTTFSKLIELRRFSRDSLQPKRPVKDTERRPASIEELNLSLASLSTAGGEPPTNSQLREKLLGSIWDTNGFPKEAQAIINHTMLYRAMDKYSFDYTHNREVVSDDPWLRDLWDWVAGADEAAYDGGMIYQGIDLSFVGVSSIWFHDLGRYGHHRLTNTPMPDEMTWNRCLQFINKRSGTTSYDGCATLKPAHRAAAVRMCGWGWSAHGSFSDYAKMPESERTSSWHTMATAHALFRGDSKMAIQYLKDASAEYPELLFVSLALQLIGRGDVDLAKEQLDFDQATASRTDPYLRAISSLIATNDWELIANQESLPLRERAYIALRNFDDMRLSQWLRTQIAKAIETGDIQGILLTGITDDLVDIFATYVEKHKDVQTATLVLSICSPRYIDDYRCTAWRNGYRAYLQRHKAYFQRTKFEVESTKKSKRGGMPTIKPPSRQIALRCIYCDAEYELSKMGSAPVASGNDNKHSLAWASINAGVSCPNCGRHLPRCVVCLEVVGVPRSDKPEASPDPEIRAAARFPTFCLQCDHVLHLDHARQWFARHVECPVPECRCRCNFRANPELNYH